MKLPFTYFFTKSGHTGVAAKSAQPLVALQLANVPSWTPKHYTALAREGYQCNPIANRCIRLVSEAAASVKLCLDSGHTCKNSSGLIQTDMMEAFYGFLQVSGNGYLEATLVNEQPVALFALRPDRMRVKATQTGRLCGYEYRVGEMCRQFMKDTATGRSQIFHMKLFNPLSDTEGYSPLAVAAQSIDIHNEGGRWTKGLLENSARPSGALIYKSSQNGQYMPGDQFDRIKDELEQAYSGARHAGRPMVLEGGLEWKSMALSPSDMDFLEARREAAREIALALGVPPMLLGIPGDNTYANYKEANQAFWRQTILPLVTRTAQGLENWLRPWFGEDITVQPDFDAVPALSEERSALWARLSNATFLTDEERRALAGLEVSQ